MSHRTPQGHSEPKTRHGAAHLYTTRPDLRDLDHHVGIALVQAAQENA